MPPDALMLYRYCWPEYNPGEGPLWRMCKVDGSLVHDIPGGLEDLFEDSRRSVLFPSPLFPVTITDGSWKGSAKLVGATVVDRFSNIILPDVCRKVFSTRHQACALSHRNPGPRQRIAVQLIRDFRFTLNVGKG